MKKNILIVLNLLAISTLAEAQVANYEWTKTIGTSSSEFTRTHTVDEVGNSYSVIWFEETVDFDPGSGVFELTPFGFADFCIQKLDENGNFVWAKQIGGQSTEIANSIALDGNGGIVLTGYFQGTTDFDPDASVMTMTAVGMTDIFVMKLNTNGVFLWAKQMSGPSEERGLAIATDAGGNVYTTGYFGGTVDFNPGSPTNNLSASSTTFDCFVQKLNANGDYEWAKKIGGGDEEFGESIAVDPQGNVYTFGEFRGTIDFDPGSGTTNLTSFGNVDAFLQKLDANGDLVWARQFGGGSFEQAVDVSYGNGNMYITGTFGATADFDPTSGTSNLTSNGDSDVYIAKLNSNGNLVWVKQIGGAGDDRSRAIYADELGDVYTTGFFNGTVDLNPGSGTTNFTSAGGRDLWIQKLDNDGDFVWAKQIGSPENDGSNSIVADQNEGVYVSGSFRGTVDFDPNTGVANVMAVGDTDAYLLKLNESDNVGIDEENGTSVLNLYPNPNNGSFKIDLGDTRNNIFVKITDVSGKVIQEYKSNQGDVLEIEINGQSGVYFVSVIANEFNAMTSFVKK